MILKSAWLVQIKENWNLFQTLFSLINYARRKSIETIFINPCHLHAVLFAYNFFSSSLFTTPASSYLLCRESDRGRKLTEKVNTRRLRIWKEFFFKSSSSIGVKNDTDLFYWWLLVSLPMITDGKDWPRQPLNHYVSFCLSAFPSRIAASPRAS